MEKYCDICGETDHVAEAHGEALSIFQPALHTIDEWSEIVLDEAEAYGADVSDLRQEFDESGLSDDMGLLDDCEDRIRDKGYCIYSAFDSWLVYNPVK